MLDEPANPSAKVGATVVLVSGGVESAALLSCEPCLTVMLPDCGEGGTTAEISGCRADQKGCRACQKDPCSVPGDSAHCRSAVGRLRRCTLEFACAQYPLSQAHPSVHSLLQTTTIGTMHTSCTRCLWTMGRQAVPFSTEHVDVGAAAGLAHISAAPGWQHGMRAIVAAAAAARSPLAMRLLHWPLHLPEWCPHSGQCSETRSRKSVRSRWAGRVGGHHTRMSTACGVQPLFLQLLLQACERGARHGCRASCHCTGSRARLT